MNRSETIVYTERERLLNNPEKNLSIEHNYDQIDEKTEDRKSVASISKGSN